MTPPLTHIWFIMDGNRTWAREHFLPQFEGHRRWYNNAKQIMKDCLSLGIPYCSFWALSDDNIAQRSQEEVTYLFDLLTKWVLDIAKDAHKDQIRLICIGNRSLLPKKCQENILKAEEMTKNNQKMTAILAIGYGWQEEIIRAVNACIVAGEKQVTKETFLPYIESAKFPPADLIVRTAWHHRHSWFLLFLSPYAEYYFSELNWPSFDKEELLKVLDDFSLRLRKFGK